MSSGASLLQTLKSRYLALQGQNDLIFLFKILSVCFCLCGVKISQVRNIQELKNAHFDSVISLYNKVGPQALICRFTSGFTFEPQMRYPVLASTDE